MSELLDALAGALIYVALMALTILIPMLVAGGVR